MIKYNAFHVRYLNFLYNFFNIFYFIKQLDELLNQSIKNNNWKFKVLKVISLKMKLIRLITYRSCLISI